MKLTAVAWIFLGFHVLPGLAASGETAATFRAEIDFSYRRQAGPGSNQIAIWVENAEGKVVRTLYVSDFTAGRGGWRIREHSVPRWVRQAGVAGMTADRIDAFTGATPSPGPVTRVWDGRDDAGGPVPAGRYRIFLEATLRQENQVLYHADVEVGGPAGEVRPEPEYRGFDVPERAMIGGVSIRFGW